MPLLEICTGDPEGVLEAIAGGADRIELCSGLAEGGLTPSIAAIRFSSSRIATNVLIRPRAGDFVYTEPEAALMESDIKEAAAAGAHGIVIGALTAEGEVDKALCSRLLAAAPELDSTFHRAFDVVADPFRALEDIISLGFRRVLTSGCEKDALEGAEMISRLREKADGRIIIMAGAGVSPKTAAGIKRLSGAEEFHASARAPRAATYGNTRSAASMGSADPDGSRMATDAAVVRAIRHAIDS
ncbi:MAG: copper homeostasis protein CutC [Bacteroidales bacterium]|nr:copper homeostasis protein CutC [Bacteroidales bacterium]MBD5217811.1 copper homeostasis protein CutC [Bacteroidales bacterium]